MAETHDEFVARLDKLRPLLPEEIRDAKPWMVYVLLQNFLQHPTAVPNSDSDFSGNSSEVDPLCQRMASCGLLDSKEQLSYDHTGEASSYEPKAYDYWIAQEGEDTLAAMEKKLANE